VILRIVIKKTIDDHAVFFEQIIRLFCNGISSENDNRIKHESIRFFLLQITKCQCQIVNLGAGFDTLFWNLKDEDLTPVRFVEMDFQSVVNRKAYYIKNRKPLLDKLTSEGDAISSLIALV
jgi:hypothetical protein